MFKKLLVVVCAALFLTVGAGNVMASPDWEISDVFYHSVTGKVKGFPQGSHPGNKTQWLPCNENPDACRQDIPGPNEDQFVTGIAEAESFNSDLAESDTGHHGNHNDFSMGSVQGWSYGSVENFASGDRFAQQSGKVFANPVDVHAWAWSKDSGLTSKAGAGAKLEAGRYNVFVLGEAFGLGGDEEFTITTIGLGGRGYQNNTAGETGYQAGFAVGGNESGFAFEASSDQYLSEGQSSLLWGFIPIPGSGVFGYKGINGEAITKGKTEVTIGPYEYNRSAYAMTENMTNIDVNAQYVSGQVFGNGSVEAGIQGFGGYAGGSASFNYSGQFNGNGSATTYNTVNYNGNGVSATSMTSSNAFADGFSRDPQ